MFTVCGDFSVSGQLDKKTPCLFTPSRTQFNLLSLVRATARLTSTLGKHGGSRVTLQARKYSDAYLFGGIVLVACVGGRTPNGRLRFKETKMAKHYGTLSFH